MKTQTDYAQLISENKDNPGALADILVDLGARVSFLTDVYIKLELLRASFWDINSVGTDGKNVSDPKLKMKWLLTKDGEQWFVTKEDLRACENARRTITQALKVKGNEAYNQY